MPSAIFFGASCPGAPARRHNGPVVAFGKRLRDPILYSSIEFVLCTSLPVAARLRCGRWVRQRRILGLRASLLVRRCKPGTIVVGYFDPNSVPLGPLPCPTPRMPSGHRGRQGGDRPWIAVRCALGCARSCAWRHRAEVATTILVVDGSSVFRWSVFRLRRNRD